MILLQKYFITDGTRYIREVKGKYVICTSPTMADVFPLRRAQKILENSLCKSWKASFYLEGEDDFTIVNTKSLEEKLLKSYPKNVFH